MRCKRTGAGVVARRIHVMLGLDAVCRRSCLSVFSSLVLPLSCDRVLLRSPVGRLSALSGPATAKRFFDVWLAGEV